MKNGCFQTKTKKEKILLYTTIALVILTVAVTIALIVIATKKDDNTTCESTVCTKAAANIMQNMDTTADPCKNFYDYACGNYKQKIVSPVQLYEPENAAEERAIQTNAKLLALLKKPPEYNEPKSFKLVKDFYASCMNTTQINALGLQPIKTILRKLGGCPMIDGGSWKEEAFSWTETLSKFHQLGIQRYGIFTISVVRDHEKPAKRIIKIQVIPRPDATTNGTERLFDDPLVSATHNTGVNISVLLGADRSRAVNHLKEVIEFLVKIANAKDWDISEDKKITVNELQRTFPHVRWVDFLNSLGFPRIINRDEEILVQDQQYISKVSSIVSRTDTRVIANALIFDAIIERAGTLDENVDNILMQMAKQLGFGKLLQSIHSRQLRCLQFVTNYCSVAFGALYIRSNEFNKDIKPKVGEIFDNIKQEVSDGISNIKWLQGKSIETAQNKIQLLSREIGFPDSLLDDSELEDYYNNVIISRDQFFYNAQNLTKNSVDQRYKSLTKPTDMTQLDDIPIVPEIYDNYIPSTNTIEMFATALTTPWFDIDRPNYLNYGAIGTLIGRDILYAVDSTGRYEDASGRNRDWWSKSTDKKYSEVQECINEEYEEFLIRLRTEKLFDVDFEKDLSGEPGDILGTSFAYNAYLKWEKNNGPEPLLPSVRLNNRQLFWISMANRWCEEGNGEILPNMYRKLSVALINSPDFAKDFDCPVGSTMNRRKC